MHAMGTPSLWQDYLTLSKKSIVLLVVLSAGMGYFLGGTEGFMALRFVWTLVGTALMCASACALNHVIESKLDKQMHRTASRPIPSGRISRLHGIVFGMTLGVMGLVCLWQVSGVMVFGGVITALLYLVLYTPLKRLTTWNTVIGGVPGALPALGGYMAACGQVGWGAWSLFGILYCWQQPHFHSIAWMVKNDYARCGFKMLTVVDATGRRAYYHTVGFGVMMVLCSVGLFFTTSLSVFYLLGTLSLGIWFMWQAVQMRRPQDVHIAKKVLKASVVYLPMLLGVMLLDSLIRVLL